MLLSDWDGFHSDRQSWAARFGFTTEVAAEWADESRVTGEEPVRDLLDTLTGARLEWTTPPREDIEAALADMQGWKTLCKEAQAKCAALGSKEYMVARTVALGRGDLRHWLRLVRPAAPRGTGYSPDWVEDDGGRRTQARDNGAGAAGGGAGVEHAVGAAAA